MTHAIVNVPVAAVRRKPRHHKEMVNQLLFGETVQILKHKGDAWVKVRSLHDGYEGWMTLSLLEETDEFTALQKSAFVTAGLLTKITVGQQNMYIPVGASLPAFTEGKAQFNDQVYVVEGTVYNRMENPPDHILIDKLVNPWLNAPYLWGGRTPLGVDCSGFIQVNFKCLGIDLPRDAWQQAQSGASVESLSEAKPGDLVFFDDKEAIVHVGLLLNPETVVHASGKVRIDPIDKKGVIHAQTGKRTYRLKAIRRYW